MKAIEARELTDCSKNKSKQRQERKLKPSQLYVKIRLWHLLKRIRRAAKRGESHVTFEIFFPNIKTRSLLYTRLRDLGYKVSGEVWSTEREIIW
jgi:hypothetical protein